MPKSNTDTGSTLQSSAVPTGYEPHILSTPVTGYSAQPNTIEPENARGTNLQARKQNTQTFRRRRRSNRAPTNLKKLRVKEGDESSRTLTMAGEAGGEPRAWLAVDETAAAFISRSRSSRPPIILPPPLHRAPLRPGNVVEISGPSNSGKSHLLLMVREAPFGSKV